jgi:hypothetical protein
MCMWVCLRAGAAEGAFVVTPRLPLFLEESCMVRTWDNAATARTEVNFSVDSPGEMK